MILIALLLASGSPEQIPVMFGGPVPSLRKLAKAAQRCGYSEAAVTKADLGAITVSLQTTGAAPSEDKRWACVLRWFLAHPRLELGFIGNRAYPDR